MSTLEKRLSVNKKTTTTSLIIAIAVVFLLALSFATVSGQVINPQSDATGLAGTVPSPPPDTPATISIPTNGAVFVAVPISVSGVCPEGLLVKLFKNDVFSGSDLCAGGSWAISVDLFSGTNELVAIVFDDLDQEGPPSNKVTVEYNDDFGADSDFQRVNLTTNFAKRGADPETSLTWPVIITGGIGPYAVSIDWGDGFDELVTRAVAGEFDIVHIYSESGVYRIVIKTTDARGQSSFLQIVGIVNGPLGEIIDGGATDTAATAGRVVYRWVTWPLFVLLMMILTSFWLGRRYETHKLKQRFAQHPELKYQRSPLSSLAKPG